MLPIPFENNIPVLLRKALSIDDAGQALADWWDEKYTELKNEILELQYLRRPDRIPSALLDELGYWLAAGIQKEDSDFTKRYKILTAIQTHKLRSTWEADAKNRIDSITGYSAAIYSTQDNDDSIEMAQQANDPDFYWSTEAAADGVDDELGTWEVGDFTEYVIAGNIYINCHEGVHTAVLSAAIIQQIVENLEMDVAPAYMAVYLGYINTTGQFIEYDVID